ncbi:MAG TPA: hypothetical protein VFB62_01540 [Polyangiaceae bacterium]|nr:hypothetical protein [Polyangiaceae bacterium]
MSRWALLSLCRKRQSARAGARASWIFGFLVAVVGIAFLALLKSPATAARATGQWLLWCTAPFLLGLASAPRVRDRQDGIEAMVLVRGGRAVELATARTFAAMFGVTLRLLLPALLFALAAASVAGPRASLLQAALLSGFACFAGILLGGIAALAGEAAGARGRELFMAIVLVPWVLADVASEPLWSIPGLLNAGLSLIEVALA